MSDYFTIHEHLYINNVFGIFVKGMADWFRNDMYPRTKDVIIASYEKSVEHYRKKQKDAGPNWSPSFPFFSLDPMLDFEPDGNPGLLFAGYPNYERGLASQLFDPLIYKDNNVTIAPVLNRYKGTFEINLWCSSVYELIDYRMRTIQTFGGLGTGRVIHPKNIYGYITLPDSVSGYTYENMYQDVVHELNWDENEAPSILIKNINQNKMTFPFEVRPWIKLSSISDSGVKYGGGGSDLSDHRLIINLEWECVFPTHITILAKQIPEICHKLTMDLQVGFAYLPTTEDNIRTAIPKELIRIHSVDEGIDEDTIQTKDLEYKNYSIYIITEEDYDNLQNNVNVEITLHESVSDCVYMDIYGKYGRLKRDIHWKLEDELTVTLFSVALKDLVQDDILKIVVYKNAVETSIE